jgi:hypothetical protein
MTGELQKEALRQQMLLRALWRDARPGVVAGWMRDGERFERGLSAYRSNAGALAERALGAAYPTLLQLLSAESFAALARAFWRAAPPGLGDIAEWGAELPEFIAGDSQLAAEPYLADIARLEWAVHAAERAADAAASAPDLAPLGQAEPSALGLRLQPGTALISSRHPIVSIWHAHRSADVERFVPVRAAFAAAAGEHALVRRCGWKVQVLALAAPAARFTGALLAGRTLGAALAAAGDGFDFESWLLDALRGDLIAAVVPEAP